MTIGVFQRKGPHEGCQRSPARRARTRESLSMGVGLVGSVSPRDHSFSVLPILTNMNWHGYSHSGPST